MNNKSKEVVIVSAIRTPIGTYRGSLKNMRSDQLGSIVIKDLLKDLKLKEYYENQRTTEGIERWENIEELMSSITKYNS